MAATLRTFLIASLMVSIFAFGIYSFAAQLGEDYSIPPSSNLTDTKEKFDVLYTKSVDVSTNMSKPTEQSGFFKFVSGTVELTSDVYQIIKLPFKLVSAINNLFTEVENTLHLPDYFAEGLSAMLLVIITLIIISLVFRRDA